MPKYVLRAKYENWRMKIYLPHLATFPLWCHLFLYYSGWHWGGQIWKFGKRKQYCIQPSHATKNQFEATLRNCNPRFWQCTGFLNSSYNVCKQVKSQIVRQQRQIDLEKVSEYTLHLSMRIKKFPTRNKRSSAIQITCNLNESGWYDITEVRHNIFQTASFGW